MIASPASCHCQSGYKARTSLLLSLSNDKCMRSLLKAMQSRALLLKAQNAWSKTFLDHSQLWGLYGC